MSRLRIKKGEAAGRQLVSGIRAKIAIAAEKNLAYQQPK